MMLNKLLVNITWNSKDWKGISDDASNHRYVKEGGVPNESWNFDFDNERNTGQKIFGYGQFTYPPKVMGANNLILFYSRNYIVGVYGKAEILKDGNQTEDVNLVGERSHSLLLPNKIPDVKEKGYLETKERIGQVGYIYLEQLETVLRILDEAIALNPEQEEKLQTIKEWIIETDEQDVAANDTTESSEPEIVTTASNINMKESMDQLNQILYGPPGTGKTYHTVNKALQIVDPEFYEVNKNDRKELTKRYRELLITDWENHKSGQIAMTTFHQSFTYEDFIEGIKPLLIDKNNENDEDPESKSDIGYEIQNGIFKNISELARQESGGKVGQAKGQIKWDRDQFNKAEFYKLSLGNVNIAEDDEIYQYCIKNNRIGIGFLWDEDVTNVEESRINQMHIDNSDYDKHDCTSMAIFRHHLKEGYYVVIANGNHKFRAIGKVVGDYFYDKDSPIRYPHFRKVEWIAKDLDLSVDLIYNKNFSQKTIYHLRKKDIKPEFFVRSKATAINSSDIKPFVLIIDEINRGNIAQIFGELITLIEEDKREGMDEEISVSLPYSKQPFSVPSNLHIIGTMNTADRSIEALDTALRRRFTFEEMPPKIRVIEDEGSLKEEKSEIRVGESHFLLSSILETINMRIEKLLDKDHLIGHSYFMDVKQVSDLQRVFYRNIIPLLEEYFYGDKGKIQLVLGQGFIIQAEHSGETDLFAQSDYDDSIFDDREVWELTTSWRYNDKAFEEALNVLLNKKA